MAFGTFKILAPPHLVWRDAETLDDTTLMTPTETDALEQGEWLRPNGSKKLVRVTDTVADNDQAFPFTGTKGHVPGQVTGKAEIARQWILAETTTYDPNGTFAVGTALFLQAVDCLADGVNRGVLTDVGAAAGDPIEAIVEVPPTDASSFTPMRIRQAHFIRHA